MHGVLHDTASPMPVLGVSGASGVSGVSGVSGASGVSSVLKKLAWWKSGAWLGLF